VDLIPGDLGVFDTQPGFSPVFRRLGHIGEALGGVEVTLHDRAYPWQTISRNLFRVTFRPLTDTTDDISGLSGLHMLWNSEIRMRELAWQYLLQSAPTLAGAFGVLPEDLVLITRTGTGYFSPTTLHGLVESLREPIHFYWHLHDDGRLSHYYWSHLDEPWSYSEAQLTPTPNPLCPNLRRVYENNPTHYLQVEKLDLARLP